MGLRRLLEHERGVLGQNLESGSNLTLRGASIMVKGKVFRACVQRVNGIWQ